MAKWLQIVTVLTVLMGAVGAASAGVEGRLDAIFGHGDFDRAVWACAVTDAATGALVYGRHADDPVIPASNQKLYVAAAAWLRQGPDFRPFTEYWARGAVTDGVLDGDLVARGFGAFCLTARFPRSRPIPERERALQAQLDGVAARLRAAGVREVRGRLLADRSRWTDMGPNAHYRSADALLFHDNTLDVLVTNGVVQCCPARLVGFRLDRTDRVRKQERAVSEGRLTDTIRVNPNAPDDDYWRIEAGDPCVYYATHVQAGLNERGVRVVGAPMPAAGAPERLLFRLPGLSVRELLPAMLTHSDNLRAEVMLLNLGYGMYGRANYVNGTRACMEVLRAHGVTGGAYRAADGCGLSLDNRVTSRDTVRLLARMAATPGGAAFRNAMAVSGMSGTIETRLAADGVRGRVHAKTGTLSSVTALSGYATTASGRTLCFSFVCNRIPGGERCWRAIGDALGILCSSE